MPRSARALSATAVFSGRTEGRVGPASLFLVLGLLFFITAHAQADPGKEEQDLYHQGKQAFADGVFDVAEARLGILNKKFPANDFHAESLLFQARALYYLGQYAAAADLLDDSAKNAPAALKPDYLFWLGESLNASERWTDAEKTYRDLLAQFPNDELVGDGQLGLGWSLLKQNRESDALPLLQTLGINQASKLSGQRATIILARYRIAQNQTKEASQLLNSLLAQSPKPETFFAAQYWLGEINLQNKQPGAAAEHFQKITDNDKAFPKSLKAESWFDLARALHDQQNYDQALPALEKAYTLADSETLKVAAFNLYLDCGRQLKRLPDTIAKLQDYAQANQSQPNGATALYAIGLAWNEAGDSDKASGTLEALLTAYPNSRWSGPALYELGKIQLAGQKFDAALDSFRKVAALPGDPVLQHQAEFQCGQILVSQNNYDSAIDYLQKSLAAGGATAERAYYNMLVIQGEQLHLDAFTKLETQFLTDFPQSPFRIKVALEKGHLLERLNQLDAAKAQYEKALADNPDNPDRSLFLLSVGDTAFKLKQYDAAAAAYDKFLNDFPNDPRLPEAAHKSVLANLVAKKITSDQALQLLIELSKRYADNARMPQILFSIGEIYYNQQSYVNARNYFEKLANEHKDSDLYDDALLWAGRAAAQHNDTQSDDLAAALKILERVPDNSPLKSEARLLQGRIYHQQMRFADAITIFDSVLTVEKTGDRFIEATMRKGDCYFALGTKDPGNYDLAANAYGIIYNLSEADLAQRNEAGYRRAKAFEMLKRPDDAIQIYLDVLQNRLPGTPDTAITDGIHEMHWQVKAGIEAARMREEKKDWTGAISIYRKLEQMGGPGAQQFRDRINEIRRDNYLYEEG